MTHFNEPFYTNSGWFSVMLFIFTDSDRTSYCSFLTKESELELKS